MEEDLVTLDFEGLVAGTVVDTQFDGVTIVAQRARDGGIDNPSENDAMIFDTANPTGGDDDLATDDQGNVVIVSEDNDSSDPDDEAGGGSISFTFDDPAYIQGLTIVDGDSGGTFFTYDEDGSPISAITFPVGPDGATRSFEIDVSDVARLVVAFNNSGGVDDLRYIPFTPEPASVGGTVFMDNDDDSVEGSGDTTIANVVVTLFQNGVEIASMTTDVNGTYLFEDLEPGEGYSVQFADVDGTSFVDPNVGSDDTIDSDAVENTDGAASQTFDLGAGEDLRNIDAGVEIVDTGDALLAGRVFMDSDDDDQDNGEMGVAGVLVTLTNAAGAVLDTTTTEADGTYLFTDLDAGDYAVVFPTEIAGKILVNQNVGPDATDSDADQTTGETGVINLGIGEMSVNNDAGIEDPGTASLGNFVFLDENGNGVFDGDDMSVSGVTVELLDVDGLVQEGTTTDANGAYLFDGLDAGIYSVRFTAPAGLEFTAASTVDADSTNDDSDANEITGATGQVELSIGEAELDVDAGLIVTDTGDASLAGRVFMDSDDDDQDNGEMGVSGVLVTLTNAAGVVLDTTTTEADGTYLFTDLDAGDYVVAFPTEIAGKILVNENVGPDATDSDADQTTGETGVISLAVGEMSVNNDAGIEDALSGGDVGGGGGTAPEANDDSGMVCADKDLTVDVLANDTGDAGITITAVDGQSVSEGDNIDVDGISVSLIGGQLVFNGEDAFEDLTFGETGTASISYTITDTDGVSANANVDLTFKGVAETIDELNATLPTMGEYQILGGDLEGEIEDDGYTLILKGTGDARFDDKVFTRAYCISILDPVIYAQIAADAPSFESKISAGNTWDGFNDNQISYANQKTAAENLDLINWIINQDFSADGSGRFNDWEVQRAIWELTDNFDTKKLDSVDENYGQDEDVDLILTLAMENGEGFVAGEGDIATMIVDPTPGNPENTQPFIVAFDFDDNNCDCPSDRADVQGNSEQLNDGGQSGSNTSIGIEESNVLVGTDGIDRMVGGEDNDTFVFASGTNLAIVYNYTDATDQIGLDGIAFADLTISEYRGNDTLIQAGDDRMILKDVDHTELAFSDFTDTPFV